MLERRRERRSDEICERLLTRTGGTGLCLISRLVTTAGVVGVGALLLFHSGVVSAYPASYSYIDGGDRHYYYDDDSDKSRAPDYYSNFDSAQSSSAAEFGCDSIFCDWFQPLEAFLCALFYGLLTVLSASIMYKVLRSYQKSAERKHEITGNMPPPHLGPGGPYLDAREYDAAVAARSGQIVAPIQGGPVGGAWGVSQGFSESSSYEAHERYEKKLQRVKKTRGERDRERRKELQQQGLRQVDVWSREEEGLTAKDALLQWTQRVTAGYPGVSVRNFTTSWRDGLAFNAILHRYRPEAVNWRQISAKERSNRDRLASAFTTAEREFGVTPLIAPEDMDVELPDERSLITYITSLYEALPTLPDEKYREDMLDYSSEAREWLTWVQKATQLMQDRRFPAHLVEIRQLLVELDKFKSQDIPPRMRSKQRLADLHMELQNLFAGTGQFEVDPNLSTDSLDRAWNGLLQAIEDRERALRDRLGEREGEQELTSGLHHEIGVLNERLDIMLQRIEDAESRIRILPPAEIKSIFDDILFDLRDLEHPITNLFDQVEDMKKNRHREASDYYKQVLGLHQRRGAYLQRVETLMLVELNQKSEYVMQQESSERYVRVRTDVFQSCEECIEWIERRINDLSEMEFVEDVSVLEETFERHKVEHRDTLDFRQQVDQCIARQAEVSAEDSGAYCDLLSTLESDYQQLRDLSTGRMLDLDSLIAFVRAAQGELVWIAEREELEVTRNWSDLNQLDLPMLQNYYKQLLHEIELREEQFNLVHDQGAALLNQGHPAVRVIEAYLTTMQAQWDWLLSLAKCLEVHLQDALNLEKFMEEAKSCENWMDRQMQLLESHYDRSDFSLEEGEKLLKELEEIREMLSRYQEVLMSLLERSRVISPLWQRGERITHPIPVHALCDYTDRNLVIRRGDECTLIDNTDLIKWLVRTPEGVEGYVPSVVFRVPPPDDKITGYLARLQAQFDRLRRLWAEKHRQVRANMVLNTMKTIRGWDLEQFLAIDPDQREAIMKALNEDTAKLVAEMDPNDPWAMRLKEQLKLTNEHFYRLLQLAMKPQEPDLGEEFDRKIVILLGNLEEAWKKLNQRVANPIPRDSDSLERLINEQKDFEDGLQSLDSEIAAIKDLFSQLPEATPMQRSRMDQLLARWEDLWELSRMYVERLKALDMVLNGLTEASQIVKEHEITLGSFDSMPADLNKLRAMHSQLLELNMVLQQQQPIMDDLGTNVGQLRQHVARTRFNVADHPDVDRLEDDVQNLTVRWENICVQVLDRLRSTEMGIQILMIYRSSYENEITWLDRVEKTIKNLRDPQHLKPDEYQEQLDMLMAEYAQLNERTQAIENVNHEGGKFIREAKTYDTRLSQYSEVLEDAHGRGLAGLLRRTQPTPITGAAQVTKELEELNRRFSQLASIILERRNVIQVLIQNWRRQKQAEESRLVKEADDEARCLAEAEAARLAAEEAERLRLAHEAEMARLRDEAERERLSAEEAERQRRAGEEAERRRREAEDARRRAEEEAERQRRLAEERARLEAERLQKENVQETYTSCEADIDQLLVNLMTLEGKLLEEMARGGGENTTDLQMKLKQLRDLKLSLIEAESEVTRCVVMTDQLSTEGADLLSPEEFHNLRRHRDQLKDTFQNSQRRTDSMIDRLTGASGLKDQFDRESGAFQKWICDTNGEIDDIQASCGNPNLFDQNNKRAQAVTQDVISHSESLKRVRDLGSRAQEELKGYLLELNAARETGAKPSLPLEYKESDIKDSMKELASGYQELVDRSQQLHGIQSKVQDASVKHEFSLNSAFDWGGQIEHDVELCVEQQAAADPIELQRQLEATRNLQVRLVEEHKILEDARFAADVYLSAIQGTADFDNQKREIENALQAMSQRYEKVKEKLSGHSNELQSLLTESQGVKAGLDEMLRWLEDSEATMNLSRPLPMNKDKLNDQWKEQQLLASDIGSRGPALDGLTSDVNKLLVSSPSAANAGISERADDVIRRYETVEEKCRAWGDRLQDAVRQLENFKDDSGKFNDWVNSNMSTLESQKPLNEDLSRTETELQAIRDETERKQKDVEKLKKLAQGLLSQANVTETAPIKEWLRDAERKWGDLSDLLAAKERLLGQQKSHLGAYEQQRDRVVSWLSETEEKIEKLPAPALEAVLLHDQVGELTPLVKEHATFKPEIEIVNNLGEAFGNVQKDMDLQPSQSKKRRSTAKTAGGTSPGSNASSGFSSYNNMVEVSANGLSPVQEELLDINHRYDLIGVRLKDRKEELNGLLDRLEGYDISRSDLSAWINDNRKAANEIPVPLSKEEAAKRLAEVRRIADSIKERRPVFDEVRSEAHELTRLKQEENVPGMKNLKGNQAQLESDWECLQEECRHAQQMLLDAKDFLSNASQLQKWLTAKQKMMAVLGPVGTDPRLIENQQEQLKVLRDECEEQKSNLDQMNQSAHSLLDDLPQSSEEKRLLGEQLSGVNVKWAELHDLMNKREEILDSAKGLGASAAAKQELLQQWLEPTTSRVEQLSSSVPSAADIDQHIAGIDALRAEVDGKAGDLEELAIVFEQLSGVSGDPSVKADVSAKIRTIRQPYEELRRKLDSLQGAANNIAAEGQQFDEQFVDLLKWMETARGDVQNQGSISADSRKLEDQYSSFQPLYKDILDHEGKVNMMKAKAEEFLKKDKANKSLGEKLDTLNAQWQPLLTAAKDRQAHLDSARNVSEQWGKAKETLEGHISSDEDSLSELARIEALESPEFCAEKMEKLQELKAVIAQQGSDYKAAVNLGERLITCTEKDSEKVQDTLENLHDRWERLKDNVKKLEKGLDKRLKLWGEYANALNDAKGTLQHCEQQAEKIASTDGKSLGRLKGLLEDLDGPIERKINGVESAAKNVDPSVAKGGEPESPLKEELEALEAQVGYLRKNLMAKIAQVEGSEDMVRDVDNALADLGKMVKRAHGDYTDLGALARDPDQLKSQENQTADFLTELKAKQTELDEMKENLEDRKAHGLPADAAKLAGDKLEKLEAELAHIGNDGEKRVDDIQNLRGGISDLLEDMAQTHNGIVEIMSSDVLSQPITGDLEDVRTQLGNLQDFKNGLEPLSQRVEGLLNKGKDLVKSAAPGVDTSKLESAINDLADSWNELKSRVSEREQKLDGAILGLGNYKDALNSMSNWLEDTEELAANQRDPSSDYKVVKAQLQEQKLLQKLIDDKRPAVEGFVAMVEQIERLAADDAERQNLRAELDNVTGRYDQLCGDADDRRSKLQDALELSEQWSEHLHPIISWLDSTEKRIQNMDNVPTDEDKLRGQIDEHGEMHQEIDGQREVLDGLVELGQRLAEVISPEDGEDLHNQLADIAGRYDRLGSTSVALGKLLNEMAEGIEAFFGKTDALAVWIDDAELRLEKFNPLAVYSEELQQQGTDLMILAEEIAEHQEFVVNVVDEGRELCKHTTGDEAVALQGRLEGLRLRYTELSKRADNKLAQLQEAIPLAETFHDGHGRLDEWLTAIESDLVRLDQASLDHQAELIKHMEEDIADFRPVLDETNSSGGRLQQLSPGDGAKTIDDMRTRLNRRFDAACEQVQRRGERLDMARARSHEVLGDMDGVLDWLKEAEQRMTEAGAASADPDVSRQQLKDQKLMNDDILSQKGRLRDLLASGNKLMRDFSTTGDDATALQEKMDQLKQLSDGVSTLSGDRLAVLEQALPLAELFSEGSTELNDWLSQMETELENAPAVIPGLHPDQLRKQQDHNQGLQSLIQGQRPIVDKFEKTGSALAALCNDDDAGRINDALENVVGRYEALRDQVRDRGTALDDTLQESSQFSDKLDGMLASLNAAAELVRHPEPIAAHPEKIRGQIQDNCALMDELEQKSSAYQAVKDAASDIVNKADPNDPAVFEIEEKMSNLDSLWDEIQTGTEFRGRSLTDTLGVAERFWDELQGCVKALKDLKRRLETADPPASQPEAIQYQQDELQTIEEELQAAAPRVDACKEAGQTLLTLVGEPERPELEQRMAELDGTWETVTDLFHKRHSNLLEALERAMGFHDTLRNLLGWLESAEGRFGDLAPVGVTLEDIRAQLEELEAFKQEYEEKAVEKEELVQAADELTQGTSPEQALAVKRPLQDLNRRWDRLNGALSDRQQKLERALLELGQFQQAYDQLMDWMEKSEKTLDDIQPSPGDLRQTEIELAKHRVLSNDVNAHQRSVDTLNDAGKRLMSTDSGEPAEATQQKLDLLNDRWAELLKNLADKQIVLEAAKSEAESFGGQIQRWLLWIEDMDSAISGTKPTGGLPETAKKQLEDFLMLENEIEEKRPNLEESLFAGKEHVKNAGERVNSVFAHQVQNLETKWGALRTKAQDRKKKLEIALKDAEEFHELITGFNEWLNQAEQGLNGLGPVSRLLDPLTEQMEDHKGFQDVVQAQREVAQDMTNKGTKLQYYCEKKDAIPIKNLLVSAKHRFDKVVSRTADRTKNLDQGYHEAKEFFDSWKDMCEWLEDSQTWLDDQQSVSASSPEKIKELLEKHKDFQRELGMRQPKYDTTTKQGKQLRDHAPKPEQQPIQEMINELRDKWNALCNSAVDRQRKLEEALLFSGQFNEAVAALLEWLNRVEPNLSDDNNVHGDLDTVTGLVDQHKNFLTELKGRSANVETVKKAAEELLASGDNQSKERVKEQMEELTTKWDLVNRLADMREDRLNDAFKDAEKFHKGAHTMLEWLSDIEMKLKFAGQLPEGEGEVTEQLKKLEALNGEIKDRKSDLESTLDLGKSIQGHCHPDAVQPMKHWMTILQARWDEVSAFAQQRDDRLENQLKELKDQDVLLDDLLRWVTGKEKELQDADEKALPENLDLVEKLIEEHGAYESELRGRQGDVDEATKGKKKKPDHKDLEKGKAAKKQIKHRTNKHPKAQQLSDRWRQLWFQSMERQRKLQDLLAYLKELKELEKFSFDDWRKRYMDWMNHKKSRVMDFFRRQDKDGDGKVTRAEFIDGILASKFPTSRLEMEKVADMFDKDGLIDYKDFIAALRPDRRSTAGPATDQDKIKDELTRQVNLCTCPHRYQAREVGEGKFRFGDNQKLRLVRILRSTVMVRVGGGWEALDEFLVKNDPCRAKGRTNLELRENFVLADGVSQTVQAFRSRRSPLPNGSQASSSSGGSYGAPRFTSTPGPITKIREKTERSIPMSKGRDAPKPWRSGTSLGSPAGSEASASSYTSNSRRSSADLLTPDYHTAASRKGARGNSLSGSRPSSRGGILDSGIKPPSRPRSRADSDMSDISVGSRDSLGSAGPTRIPSLRGKKGVPWKR